LVSCDADAQCRQFITDTNKPQFMTDKIEEMASTAVWDKYDGEFFIVPESKWSACGWVCCSVLGS
jgi:hypothetical protein